MPSSQPPPPPPGENTATKDEMELDQEPTRQPSKDLNENEGGEDQDQEEEPDSPPLPNKHTAVTPGPRATRLQELFASTLKHTLDKINRDNFAACYPTVAQRAPGTLEFVQRQMVGRLGLQCDVSFFLSLFSFFFFFFWGLCLLDMGFGGAGALWDCHCGRLFARV